MELQLVEPSAHLQLVNPGGHLGDISLLGSEVGIRALQWIEECGRISHRSEDRQIYSVDPAIGTWDRFIRTVVLGHGDWSIVEHATASVLFDVDRGVTHELVRHRLFSYTQESTRFVNYGKTGVMRVVKPRAIVGFAADQWTWIMEHIMSRYEGILSYGHPPQLARSVLPNALASRIMMTGNLRSWRWFFIMRTTKETHPQMREVSIPLLEQFKLIIPILYDDIIPEARQIDNLRLPK